MGLHLAKWSEKKFCKLAKVLDLMSNAANFIGKKKKKTTDSNNNN